MLRTNLSGVMRVVKASGVVAGLAAVLALTVRLASTALAGTGVGGVFNLGQTNSVDAQSFLQGNIAGRTLALLKNASGPALGLQVQLVIGCRFLRPCPTPVRTRPDLREDLRRKGDLARRSRRL